MARDELERSPDDERTTAWPIRYEGENVYQKSFPGTGFGVVFEDDGATGCFYATDETWKILDALHLYNLGDATMPRKGDEIHFVWNQQQLKAGIFYNNRFQAIVDFRNRRACCRTGFPPPSEWCKSEHGWVGELEDGLL